MQSAKQTSSSTMPQYHAVIIGGGLVGKSAALLLAQQGMRVALLAPIPPQAATGGAWDSRIYAFSRSSQQLLEKLRVWQALDHTRAEPVRAMQVFGDDGGALELTAYSAGLNELAWIVEQRHVEQALDAALRFAHQVEIIPQLATQLEFTAEAAYIGLPDGRQLTAECVVGADGANSWVRQQANIAIHPQPYGQLGVVANFTMAKPHHGTAYQWFMGEKGASISGDSAPVAGDILALLPLPDGHTSMVWSANEKLAKELLALSPEALCQAIQAAMGGAVGQRTGALTCVTPAQGFPLIRRTTETWVKPRLVLAGDAAHVIHPLAGQGMNLGLRDVVVLGEIFAAKESFRDYGDLKLLRRYERARKGDTAVMGGTMHGLHGLFAQTGAMPSWLRNAGMQTLTKLPFLKRLLIERALG